MLKYNKGCENMEHFESCIICGKPLVYHQEAIEMECEICHKKFKSYVACCDHHFVCDECHSKKALHVVYHQCQSQKSTDPIEIFRYLIQQPAIHMHGPEHHVLVGCSLLTAYYNAGGKINFQKALTQIIERGSQVPGGSCGFFGNCGAAVSTGIFISVITHCTPLSTKEWQLCNLMTSLSLEKIALADGPRCCKRNSYLAILTAIEFVNKNFDVHLKKPQTFYCIHSPFNKQCLKNKCPFYQV